MHPITDITRRSFLAQAGKGLGLAALTFPPVKSLHKEIESLLRSVQGRSEKEIVSDEGYWFNIRQAYSITHDIINLNNAGVCPSPRIVTEALQRYEWQQEELPSYTMWRILEPQSETIRSELARLLGCDKEEIAITRNASESMEILLFGMDFKPGDEILTTTQDYPHMITTLRQRQRRDGIVLTLIPLPVVPENPSLIVEEFRKRITAKTKLILVSHMIFSTGQILPVKEICELGRSNGIEVVVDGAHTFGHIDFTISDLGCDYFGTSLHKWLCAPKGTGMLYINRIKIKNIWPLTASESDRDADIRKFEEIGTHSAAPKLAIGEALLFHNGIGSKLKESRLRYLSRHWIDRLKNISTIAFNTPLEGNRSCAIVNVNIRGIDPQKLVEHLFARHRIYLIAIKNQEFQGLRVSPNIFTTLQELDRFCEAMERAAIKGLPN